MSNFDDWSLYTKEVMSPQPFIDAAFYFMIGAALQRRVWLGGLESHPVFANQYMTFIGPAGSGKSLITTSMKNVLDIRNAPTDSENEVEANLKAEDNEKNFGGRGKPLVYLAPNSTTFEQITQETSRVVYLHRYKDANGVTKVYNHSSLVFVLDEITSIFKHHSEDLTNYLLEAYNGGKRYVRKLKHGSSDFCTNICVSMLGNTTNEKFQSMQNKDIMTDGFMSRSVIIYGQSKRFGIFMIPDLTPDQVAALKRLQDHVRALATVFGPMTWAAGAREYCDHHFVHNSEKLHTNKHPMLSGYYERQNLHFMKLLLSVHFAEKTDMVITLDECEKTMGMLLGFEKNMHIPYVGLGRNETAKVAEQMAKVIGASAAGIPRKKLFMQFHGACKSVNEFDAIIKDLVELGRIKETLKEGVVTYVRKD
ncbi:MAG: DUF3987 domain-containing protein [Caulobacteraceae bacterium]|nr:DUF3987 domain-containing protein [Caulobacteraceae bacterium]